jgi:catechol 2,3-dioxygenase-like lactoylglutathione lyase family enzyme
MQKTFQGIDTIIIRVSDLSVSSAWYKEKLGMEIVFEDPGLRLTVLNTGGPTSLTLWETMEKMTSSMSFPILKTFDAAQIYQTLKSRGVSVGELLEDPGVRYFTFLDPDGNKLEACEVIA